MTDKQQTAVQWLMERIRERQALAEPGSKPSFKPLFDKALEMEREQMLNAQMDMFLHIIQTPYGLEYLNQREEAYSFAEQYFTNTYKTEP